MITIYHNPRCQKSRTALAHLEAKGEKIKVVEYLKNTPSEKELKELLSLLKLKPIDIVRKKESVYIEKYKNGNYTDSEWIKILVENPVLIERPIVVKDNSACIARDETTVNKL